MCEVLIGDTHVLRQGLGIPLMMALITWLHHVELGWDSHMKRRRVEPDLNAGATGDWSWLGYDFGLLDIWGWGVGRWKSDPWPKLGGWRREWETDVDVSMAAVCPPPRHHVSLFSRRSTKNLTPERYILCLYPRSRYEKYFNQFFQPADCLPNCSPADVCKCN